MTAPRVSVVIPTYNRAALLREAVDSVLAQSYTDLEIIVVDDGSTDGTRSAIDGYADNLRYVHQPNRGVNAARNLGLQHAQGQYIALLDSDDLWEPYKLQLQVALLDRFGEIGFAFSNFFILKNRGRTIDDGIRSWHARAHQWRDFYAHADSFAALGIVPPDGMSRTNFGVYRGDVHAASLVEPFVLPSTVLMRRTALHADLRFTENDATCGDWEFFARLSQRHGALYVDLETTFNRSHEDAVRLTRIDASVQVARRVAMIDRVWRADAGFLGQHSAQVDRVQRELLLQLAKLQLFASRNSDARASLRRAAALSPGRSTQPERVMRLLAAVPGCGWALRAARAAIHALRRVVHKPAAL